MSNLDEKVNDLIADIKRQSENENKAITREMADYREASLKEAEQAIAFAAKKHIKKTSKTISGGRLRQCLIQMMIIKGKGSVSYIHKKEILFCIG